MVAETDDQIRQRSYQGKIICTYLWYFTRLSIGLLLLDSKQKETLNTNEIIANSTNELIKDSVSLDDQSSNDDQSSKEELRMQRRVNIYSDND